MRPAAAFTLDVFGPIVAYLVLHTALKLSDAWSLAIAAGFAAAMTIYRTIRRGKPNGIGVLVLVELAISLVLILLTHDARILLFKPVVLLTIAAAYILFTCFYGRPVAYQSALAVFSRAGENRAEAFERAWETSPEVRIRLRIMTGVWGVVLLLDAVVRAYFARAASITEALIAPHAIDTPLILIAIAVASVQFRRIKQLV